MVNVIDLRFVTTKCFTDMENGVFEEDNNFFFKVVGFTLWKKKKPKSSVATLSNNAIFLFL